VARETSNGVLMAWGSWMSFSEDHHITPRPAAVTNDSMGKTFKAPSIEVRRSTPGEESSLLET
jgi:hypothetical protein